MQLLKDDLLIRYILMVTNNKRGKKVVEKTCKRDHSEYLCFWASNEKSDVIKEITKRSKHICFNYGWIANSEKNLCNPMPLD